MTLYVSAKSNLEEKEYFRKLINAGRKLGLKMFVFTPSDVNAQKHLIYGHHYDAEQGGWTRRWTPFPQLIYDRCRYQPTERFRQFRRFRATYTKLIYLNRPIANKWGVHQFLSQVKGVKPHMPATFKYDSHETLLEFIRSRRIVYVKPINGTGGRGIIRLERRADGKWLVQGRNKNRRIVKPKLVSTKQLPAYMDSWQAKNDYLIQQGISSKLPDGRVHDFRLLIQKTGSGEWDITGCAGRIGPRQSITSNLHGGGNAIPMAELLGKRFSSQEKIDSIRNAIYTLGYETANAVEAEYGRLCELGIDIAVDPDGHPWLLELNPKPAREVFDRIGEKETYEKAISRPLEYAKWLYKQHASAKVMRKRRGKRAN